MKEHLLIKYAPEIFLKGANRKIFEDRLMANIRAVLVGEEYKISKDQLRWFIETEEGERLAHKVAKVFGVMEVDLVEEMEADLDTMSQAALKILKEHPPGTTFKVVTSRANKKFPLNSMEISRDMGAKLLRESQGYSVDVRDPQVVIRVEVRGKAYVYRKKFKGAMGMPYGSNGSTLLMLSGGIDSPVAGYLMAKRGVRVTGIYYHSHPYTSERAKDKVKTLASILKQSTGQFRLIIPSFTAIQMEIMDKCPEDELTIIMRRFMMRLACAAAKKHNIQSVTTGESVGQVASQTMEALVVSDAVADRPVFRPLVAMDKTDIMDLAQRIGSYETSILPYEDCCTIFVPKHPKTKPRLADIEAHEAVLDVEALVATALAEAEVIEL